LCHGGGATLDGGVRGGGNGNFDSATRQIAQGSEIQRITYLEHRAMMPEITRGFARMRASPEQGFPSWHPLAWSPSAPESPFSLS
jgi:hypothetical protein